MKKCTIIGYINNNKTEEKLSKCVKFICGVLTRVHPLRLNWKILYKWMTRNIVEPNTSYLIKDNDCLIYHDYSNDLTRDLKQKIK